MRQRGWMRCADAPVARCSPSRGQLRGHLATHSCRITSRAKVPSRGLCNPLSTQRRSTQRMPPGLHEVPRHSGRSQAQFDWSRCRPLRRTGAARSPASPRRQKAAQLRVIVGRSMAARGAADETSPSVARGETVRVAVRCRGLNASESRTAIRVLSVRSSPSGCQHRHTTKIAREWGLTSFSCSMTGFSSGKWVA